MAKKGWLESYGLDPQKRAGRVRQLKRVKAGGYIMLAVALAATIYLMLREPPATPYDAYAMAVAFSVLIAASLNLISKVETDIMLCELLDELKR